MSSKHIVYIPSRLKQGWVKQFHDGTSEKGFDYLIDSGSSSWSKGKLSNIDNVKIYDGNDYIGLSCGKQSTEWHQFDRYIVDSSIGKSEIILRVVQAKITKDCNEFITFTKNDLFEEENLVEGKWITLAYDTKKKTYNISICNKGEV